MSIKIFADVEPVPFKRVIARGKKRYNPPKYAAFKETLGLIAKLAMGGRAPLKGAIKILVEIYKARAPTSLTFGDADNHLKAVLDALNGIAYVDDRQVTDARARLFKGKPHIIIEVEELNGKADSAAEHSRQRDAPRN